MKTILAPVDFSPATPRVIATAAALARALEGRVVLLNVTQRPNVVGDTGELLVDLTALTEKAAESARIDLEALEEKLEADFVSSESIQLTGVPVTRILEQAKKLSADYIVLGSHGHTAFYDLLVGSTARAILKRASCPVVVVPGLSKPVARTSRRAK